MNSKLRSDAFTLIEVLIAMTILAVISIGIVQATRKTYDFRDVLQHEAEFFNSIRISSAIIERDITMIYQPKIFLPPKQQIQNNTQNNNGGNDNSSNGQANQPPGVGPDGKTDEEVLDTFFRGEQRITSTFWRPIIDRTGVRPSRFLGEEAKMSFLTMSNVRIYKNSKQSIFAKVIYELRPTESDEPALEGSRTLFRRVNLNVFEVEDPNDDDFTEYPILDGIKEFKLEYYSKEKDRWYRDWDSDKEEFKDVFPTMARLTLNVVGDQRLSYDGIYEFRLEVPYEEEIQPSL